MTIIYELSGSLYVNITNRCSNSCVFCVRQNHDGVNGKDDLWLEREPTVDEIKADFLKRDLSLYKEVVFCGYGEPTERFFDMIEVAKWLKSIKSDIVIRVNTNGHANLICQKDVTPYLKDAIDIVSISLNAPDKEKYQQICRSRFGEDAFSGLLDFAKRAKNYAKRVILSVVDKTMPDGDIEKCRKIAKDCGVEFRVRDYIE